MNSGRSVRLLVWISVLERYSPSREYLIPCGLCDLCGKASVAATNGEMMLSKELLEPFAQPNLVRRPSPAQPDAASGIRVALLTGGGDRPYAFGLATALISNGVGLDVIGSDELDSPEFHGRPGVNFLNLRGDQRPDVCFLRKVLRVLVYYVKLIRYTSTARPKVFHILWNNKFEFLDRTLLMLYYRLLRKRIVLTVHNVNVRKRDSKDTPLNRLTLRVQYRLADHLFVHTERMKAELVQEFGVPSDRVTVIPFGINNAVPNTSLSPAEARLRLGIANGERVILFFGNIAPYKGLEYLIAAFQNVARRSNYRLIIAGRPKDCEDYWKKICETLRDDVSTGRIVLRSDYVPDAETEVYFKAADVLVLPYTYIFQSGVLFLGYSFGLPVIATNVGSLRDDIAEGQTGFLCKPRDPDDIARAIETYFASDLYKHLPEQRHKIGEYAHARHSWHTVSDKTREVYRDLQAWPT